MGAYLPATMREFENYRSLAERALAQVDDAAFFRALDPALNSLAVLVKHMAGNLRSRWTDFLETDGEKPDRDRDGEFEIGPADTRASLMARWGAGWALVFETLQSLDEADLGRTVRVRWEEHTALAAIQRQLGHAAYHCGQIVMLARHHTGDAWSSLSIPRGESEAFNRRAREAASGGAD
jgi:hypothetical protein